MPINETDEVVYTGQREYNPYAGKESIEVIRDIVDEAVVFLEENNIDHNNCYPEATVKADELIVEIYRMDVKA